MKKIAFLLVLVMLPAMLPAQETSLADYFPFAQNFDSTRTVLLQCPKPELHRRYPSETMTPFQFWMTNFPLLPKGTPVTDWQGNKIREAGDDAILDIPVDNPDFTDDDLLFYLALNFLYLDSMVYKFDLKLTESQSINYDQWLTRDYEANKNGEISYTELDNTKQDSYREFRNYLDFILTNLNSENLMLNTQVISHSRVKPGNMFIQFSDDSLKNVSHVSLVLDVSFNVDGIPWMLIAYGGDPAQSIVMPNAYREKPREVWFNIENLKEHLSEYGKGFFYRFSGK